MSAPQVDSQVDSPVETEERPGEEAMVEAADSRKPGVGYPFRMKAVNSCRQPDDGNDATALTESPNPPWAYRWGPPRLDQCPASDPFGFCFAGYSSIVAVAVKGASSRGGSR